MNLTERQKKILTTFVLTVITVISSIPLLSRTLLWGADLEFHLFRIEGIAQGLRRSIPPYLCRRCRWGVWLSSFCDVW